MKNLNTLTIMSALSGLFFSSCNKDNDWDSKTFTGRESAPKFFGPGFDSSLKKLDDDLKKIKSNPKISKALKQKTLDYRKTSDREVHESLLKLKGRKIDLIGMIHSSGRSDEPGIQNIRNYQTEIVKLIETEGYQVMFTEDFCSDKGVIDSKEKMIADFSREAFDAGSRPSDEQIEQIVLRPILHNGESASMRIALTNPAVKVVGIDWYPVKRIQQHFHSEMRNAFDAEESKAISRSLTHARDVYLLCELAKLQDSGDKKTVLVFGIYHIPHLAFLLKSYGVSGKIWLKSEFFKETRMKEEFEHFKLD